LVSCATADKARVEMQIKDNVVRFMYFVDVGETPTELKRGCQVPWFLFSSNS